MRACVPLGEAGKLAPLAAGWLTGLLGLLGWLSGAEHLSPPCVVISMQGSKVRRLSQVPQFPESWPLWGLEHLPSGN